MKRQVIALLGVAIFSVSCAHKEAKQDASKYTDDQKASYYIGLSIAQGMKQDGFKVDADMLARAIKEEMEGKTKSLPAEDMNSFMQTFMEKQNEKADHRGGFLRWHSALPAGLGQCQYRPLCPTLSLAAWA